MNDWNSSLCRLQSSTKILSTSNQTLLSFILRYQYPSLEGGVSMVINNVWLKNVKSFFASAIVDDPARSCFPQSRLSCTSCTCKLPASHHMRLAKVLKGCSKRSWAGMGRQEAIFQLHLLLNANFPATSTAPSSSFKIEFHIRQQGISPSTSQLPRPKTHKDFPSTAMPPGSSYRDRWRMMGQAAYDRWDK